MAWPNPTNDQRRLSGWSKYWSKRRKQRAHAATDRALSKRGAARRGAVYFRLRRGAARRWLCGAAATARLRPPPPESRARTRMHARTHAHTPEADGSCEVPPSLSHLLSLSLFQSEYTTSIIFILLYTLLYCYICYYSLPGGDAQPALCSTTASSMSAPTKAALVGYSIIYCEYNII